MNDVSELRALSEGARDLLADKSFTAALLGLRKRFFDDLMFADTTEKKLDLIAQIKALEAIPAQLQVQINDYRMALTKQARHG